MGIQFKISIEVTKTKVAAGYPKEMWIRHVLKRRKFLFQLHFKTSVTIIPWNDIIESEPQLDAKTRVFRTKGYYRNGKIDG